MLGHSLTLAQNSGGGGGIGAMIVLVIYLAIIVLVIAGMWKVFTKAGQPGWGVLIPIYNIYLMLQIAGRPWWWLFLFLIPFVSLVITLIVSLDIAKAFGKGVLFGLGLFFLSPIFYCILGFGSAEYQGPSR